MQVFAKAIAKYYLQRITERIQWLAMNVSDLMAHYRVKTQMDLAKKVGVSQPWISRWARNGIPWAWQCQMQVATRGKLKAVKK